MAGDTEVQTQHGLERRRDLGDGVTAPIAVVADADGIPVTPTTPLPIVAIDPFFPFNTPAVSAEHGENMHLADGSFSGTPIPVYDADTVLWTATAPVGPASFTAASNEQNHTPAGTNSAKWTSPSEGDTIQFAKPTPPQVLSGHIALTFWIFISSGYSVGDSIEVYGWDGGVVGTAMPIEPKIDVGKFGEWQLVSFTLLELGLDAASVDAFRLQYVTKSGPAPTVYIDDVGIQEASGAEEFFIAAPPGFLFSIARIYAIVQETFTPVLTDGVMQGFDPTGLLGQARLTNGVLFQVVVGGVLLPAQGVIKDACDFFMIGYQLTDSISGGGETCITLTNALPHPLLLSGDVGLNHIVITVRDDLTPFGRVHIIADGGITPLPVP